MSKDSVLPAPPDCGHDICLMEAALHERGACTEFDQIVLGVYCPHSVCASNAARGITSPVDSLPRYGQPSGAPS